ncbi:hypothetical protein NA57DRAFT_57669 [Rhizodiscina lignyota]|uniref:U4/U6.U5 small nuclear ribonucleoprotein 27kDa protein domain-containing protein n=1 Tax=Rhizodiscina lignyota TaxID=1504668 RepID=A0A9P4M775_9PEZI|nr:hypothetical protein NA57DRAFT_57669 [Rhizodiscina lignyota]
MSGAVEPPAKRSRRTNSAAMWEQNSNSAQARDRERATPAPTEKTKAIKRERSRSRDRRDGRRDRDRDYKNSRTGGLRDRPKDRDERDMRRERSRSPDRRRGGGGRGGPRDRSRSPQRDDKSNYKRTRSPPRGPRLDRIGDGQRGRDIEPPPKKDTTTNMPSTTGPSVPTSIEPRKTKLMPKSQKADGDVVMADGVEEEEHQTDLEALELIGKVMGFAGFRTTKDTKIPGNDKNYGIHKEKKASYRQYMNRTGGFNRPLSPG